MVVRKLTLNEWFLQYQLIRIQKKSFHMPVAIKLDITAVANSYEASQQRLPLNALMLKAMGQTVAAFPEFNRTFFKTFWGPRFLESPDVRINFPMQIESGGKAMTTAIVLQDTHRKSIDEINADIKAAKQRPIKSFPITRFVYESRNHFFNRLALRTLYRLLMASPRFYQKMGGGGISLSSLTHLQNKNMILTPFAYGPTGFTFCMNSVEKVGNQTFLHFGVGYDHFCHSGAEALRLVNHLCQNLTKLAEPSPARKSDEMPASR